jgi:hypothetical protein
MSIGESIVAPYRGINYIVHDDTPVRVNLLLVTLASPRNESATLMVIKPLVHFPSPCEVHQWVLDSVPTSKEVFNFIGPNLVNLKGTVIMTVPVWVTWNDI